MPRRIRPSRLLALLAILGALAIAGCGATATGDSGAVRIVAAENFWGSIAAQLGGDKASVQSIISNPAEDPHSYEPTAQDARTLATSQLAIVNGVGYDPWAPKLIAANPTSGRTVLTVGDLFGLKDGDNPHRWYDPAEVEARRQRDHRRPAQARPQGRRLLRRSGARRSRPRTWPATTS